MRRFIAGLVCAGLVGACGGVAGDSGLEDPETGSAPRAPAANPDPERTPPPRPTDGRETPPRQTVEVLSVTDGDTIRVRINGRSVPVRYIGIDAPELATASRPARCFGQEASAFNAGLVQGKRVELEKDVSETDRHGRLLRYVWADGRMVNEELVRHGYARAKTYRPDVRHQGRLNAVHAEARLRQVGLWSPSACPTTFRAPALLSQRLEPRTP